jgi:ketosteroid isomerase-like protein
MLSLLSCNSNSGKKIDHTFSETDVKKAIKKVMSYQKAPWNNQDLEGFMNGYWKNDSLKFYGSKGLTYGWDQTLSNYKKAYSTQAESGTLRFIMHDVSEIENSAYLVFGEYCLERNAGNTNGIFTLIFKYNDGQWKIIADMSC